MMVLPTEKDDDEVNKFTLWRKNHPDIAANSNVQRIDSEIMKQLDSISTDPLEAKHWSIIDPSSKLIVFWDFLHLVALMYISTSTPYVISFLTVAEYNAHWSYITDRVTDVFYSLDIIANFRLGYVDSKSGNIVFNGKKIARSYLRGWFTLDLVATIPWDLLLPSLLDESQTLKISRLVRLFRLSRIAKLMRLLKVSTLMEKFEDEYGISRNHLLVVKLLANIVILAHFTACGFYLTSVLNTDGTNRWISRDGIVDDTPTWERYTTSLYWAFTTMTTVGFGDIVPVSPSERLFTIIAMLVSAGTYAYTIASMSNIVANMNVSKSMYFERLNELNAYMRARDLPPSLELRTRKYYRYYLQRKTVHDETAILDQLPTNLRGEITDHYIRMTIKNVQFFQGMDRNFTAQMAMHLKPMFVAPHSTVIEEGDVGEEMFIITKGILQVFQSNPVTKTETMVAFLYDGTHFGEMALLLEEQNKRRNASVRAQEYCELYALDYDYLTAGLSRHAVTLEKLMVTALERQVLLNNLRKTKVTSLIQTMQKKNTETKRFKKLAKASRISSGQHALRMSTKELLSRVILNSKREKSDENLLNNKGDDVIDEHVSCDDDDKDL